MREQPKPSEFICSYLSSLKKEKLRKVLRKNKGVYGWNIFDFKGRNPTNSMHKIKLVEKFKPIGFIDTSFREASYYRIKWSSYEP